MHALRAQTHLEVVVCTREGSKGLVHVCELEALVVLSGPGERDDECTLPWRRKISQASSRSCELSGSCSRLVVLGAVPAHGWGQSTNQP